jgi:hypothetical protein
MPQEIKTFPKGNTPNVVKNQEVHNPKTNLSLINENISK